jgi:hypothetical protein
VKNAAKVETLGLSGLALGLALACPDFLEASATVCVTNKSDTTFHIDMNPGGTASFCKPGYTNTCNPDSLPFAIQGLPPSPIERCYTLDASICCTHISPIIWAYKGTGSDNQKAAEFKNNPLESPIHCTLTGKRPPKGSQNFNYQCK